MKKISTLFFGIFCMLSVANAQDLTVFDFDGTTHAYENWDGDTFASVANPLPDAVNSSANVGLYTHGSNSGSIGIQPVSIDPAVYKSVEMMVYAPTGGVVTIQTMDASWGNLDWFATTTVAPGTGWVKLSFDLTKTTQIGIMRVLLDYYTGVATPTTAYYDNLVFKTTTVTGIAKTGEQVFSVYPNPATNYILTRNAQKVTILDLNGRTVKEAFNSEKVDVSSLAKGAYIVKAQIENTTKIGKLIKE